MYFHFGASERERANPLRSLQPTPLAVIVTGGILLCYSYCAVIAYHYWVAQPEKLIFLYIAVISALDCFYFFLLWSRSWLWRGQVNREAGIDQNQIL